MDELIKESLSNLNIVEPTSLVDASFGLISSLMLSSVIAFFYIKTHSGYSYSKNFTFSLILVSITVALIMIIIGSNIARAFALVGAMSIVRFRNPIKETRDLVYIFMSIAVGMTCGTGFYIFGIVYLILIGFVEIFFKFSQFGNINKNNYIISVALLNEHYHKLYSSLEKNFDKISIISKEFTNEDNSRILLVLNVKIKKNTSINIIFDKLQIEDSKSKFEILSGDEDIEN